VVSFTPQGKSPWYPVDPRDGLDMVAKRNNPDPYQGIKPHHPVHGFVTVLTSAYLLCTVYS